MDVIIFVRIVLFLMQGEEYVQENQESVIKQAKELVTKGYVRNCFNRNSYSRIMREVFRRL